MLKMENVKDILDMISLSSANQFPIQLERSIASGRLEASIKVDTYDVEESGVKTLMFECELTVEAPYTYMLFHVRTRKEAGEFTSVVLAVLKDKGFFLAPEIPVPANHLGFRRWTGNDRRRWVTGSIADTIDREFIRLNNEVKAKDMVKFLGKSGSTVHNLLTSAVEDGLMTRRRGDNGRADIYSRVLHTGI